MSTTDRHQRQQFRSVAELRKLPRAEQEAILQAAAEQAAAEYESNPSLTEFETFGEDDLHGDSANSETR